jgi:plasmid stabilization system protein ParE
MSSFVVHPEAFTDLDEIWEHIAADNIEGADRVRDEVFDAVHNLVPFSPGPPPFRPHFPPFKVHLTS